MTQTRLTLEQDGVAKWSMVGEAEWQEMTFEVGGKVHMAALWVTGEYADVLLRYVTQGILCGRDAPREKQEWDENAATINTYVHRLWTKAVGQSNYDKEEWRVLAKALGNGGVHV